MSENKYVSLSGLSAYTENIKNLFATKESVSNIEEIIDVYILNVDYTKLKAEFDGTSSVMGTGKLGMITLGY